MSRAKRMQTIVQLRDAETLEVERRLAAVGRELDVLERQHKELHSARDEYAAQLQSGDRQTITGAEIRTLLVFVQRIDEAVAELDKRVSHKRNQHRELQQQWIQARDRCRALREIAERYRAQEYGAVLQREQREHDDWPRRPLDN